MAYIPFIYIPFYREYIKDGISEKNKTFCVKIILLLQGTWKLYFTMKIAIIINNITFICILQS
jgi:hypothetical protein